MIRTTLMMLTLIGATLAAAGLAAAHDGHPECDIPMVGGEVDRRCDDASHYYYMATDIGYGAGCWAIGWFCGP
jgi:hypothetical protein